MKKLLLLSLISIVPVTQAHLVELTEITNYITTFCLVRKLSKGMKSDIVTRVQELFKDIFQIDNQLLKDVLFEETNASEEEKTFFNSILGDEYNKELSEELSTDESWYSIEEFSSESSLTEELSLYDRYIALQNENLENNMKYIESFNIANGTQFIPTSLCNNLYARPFIQLTARRQNGVSCGYWTLANTKALSEQLQNNTVIDIAQLYNRSQEIFNEIIQKDDILTVGYESSEELFPLLTTDWAIDIAQKINLDAYTMLNFQRGSDINIYAEKRSQQNIIAIKEDDVLKADYVFDYETFNLLEKMKLNFHQTIINKIKNNKNSYFLFCSGTHWTSFTITKNDDGLAYLIFINSASPDTTCYDFQTAQAYEGITEFNGQIDEGSYEHICATALLEVVEHYNNKLFNEEQ